MKQGRGYAYDLYFHIIFCVKYRKRILKDEIRDDFISIVTKICHDNDFEIVEINTDEDHVHILFETSPQTQLSKLINNYKTVTSRLIRKEFSKQLEQYYWKPYFWSDTYFISSVSDTSEAMIKRYIEKQGNRKVD